VVKSLGTASAAWRRRTPSEPGFSWSKAKVSASVVISKQSRFLRPAETCETTTEPVAPASVSKRTRAASSVSTARASPSPSPRSKEAPADWRRRSWAMLVRATSEVIRWPLTNSTRSHQCEPMSAKAREGPPSSAATRQL
jgi:hypothetical protein